MIVKLAVPCLVNELMPQIGRSLIALLEHLDCQIELLEDFVCCGQPAFNAGDWQRARPVAKAAINVLKDHTQTLCPSGSCTAMMRNFYPQLELPAQVGVLELSEFLDKYALNTLLKGHYNGVVFFHPSCHALRELCITADVLALFPHISVYSKVTLANAEVCCGFGGMFCLKFPDVAQAIALSRLEPVIAAGADTLVSADAGCVLHLSNIARQHNLQIKILHLAEFLAQAVGVIERD